jgi:uncharacterized phiE125 gp8 family phage protein
MRDYRDFKVITPVSAEPVSLIAAKKHLRETSTTFAGDISVEQSIKPGNYAVSTVTGNSVDVLGKLALVNLNAGTCGLGGSVATKIQHSDNGTTWFDYAAFAAVTEANDNAILEKEYTGGKKYVRVVAAVTGTACEFSADVIMGTGETQEDDEIEELITSAREECEDITGRAFATQTIEVYLDSFPARDYIELPMPPLQSVASFKYTDYMGKETTLIENTDYIVDADSEPGRIILPYSKSWPSVTLHPKNPIVITIVTGYSSEQPIPKSLIQAMKIYIGYFYDNRSAEDDKNVRRALESKLSRYKVRWF